MVPIMYRLLAVLIVYTSACSPEQMGCAGAKEEVRPAKSEKTTAKARKTSGKLVRSSSSGKAIEYRIDLSHIKHGELHVAASVPHAAPGDLEIMVPTWTPGSYSIRDYARHIVVFEAFTPAGAVLRSEKVAKNRWKIAGAPAGDVVLRYRIYAHDMSVRDNYAAADLVVIASAGTYAVPADTYNEFSYALVFEKVAGDHTIATALPKVGPAIFRAQNFDMLVDSPILIGELKRTEFVVGGAQHELVHARAGTAWELEKSLNGVKKIVEAQIAFWGSAPYEHYTFLNLLSESGYGGLEHNYSTLMEAPRFSTRNEESFVKWLGLVSHEFFHTWNVRRLRPKGINAYDYEKENYTRSLWVAEGITSYYDDLILVRAGLIDEEKYLALFSKTLARVQNDYGRRVQTLSDSSFDTWIKLYQPDEDSHNAMMSYYRKGALVGFLLDMRIRMSSRGRYSLDDVMRQAYERFAQDGYSPADFEGLASEVAGEDLAEFFEDYVRGTKELNFEKAFSWLGLAIKSTDDDDANDKDGIELGFELDASAHITRVDRESSAWHAGLQPGDELLAVNNFRAPRSADELKNRLRADEKVKLLVARDGFILRLDYVPTAGNTIESAFVVSETSTVAQTQRRHSWLGVQ